ncbi:cell division protein ZapA [Candidatus Venteria ishoeyi]|uniref:Cell division protein ZapA n=1 Tax=Candidatus Venteria ishoeyi TaxID=1899563 RepID=A0A1H6FAA7_9GAMM|nr:cell division protein ZapA [Candidatus Venteria ishoeyi]MDM8545039.1 cell division protein ZapA [Candidatus Venteria ishoeyi]SEH07027.1 Cell division protein ZapA [Candidatus Venteria ishoeyi]
MRQRARQFTLHILDKEYVVACQEGEREDLKACADYLAQQMQMIREGGKVVGTERLLVMAALNIVHELLQYKTQKNSYTENLEDKEKEQKKIEIEIQRLEQKIYAALEAQR